MRVLLRRLKRDKWKFDRPVWRFEKNGTGVATYRACGPERTYTLIAFAHDLPSEKRSDRVIAEAWDATFVLFDGEPSPEDIERLSRNVPLQEAGRISQKELTLSRANRSVRMFDHVVENLAAGKQPDERFVEQVGYLMRTTAVYGAGKFGAADREIWAGRTEFSSSFQPEMLTVWLIRSFTLDLVEHLAKTLAPGKAATISPKLRWRFGVGNSTGLGMAPFLINHPSLIHTWVNARELALARVRSIEIADPIAVAHFKQLVQRARLNADQWNSAHPSQLEKVRQLRDDLGRCEAWLSSWKHENTRPWDALYRWIEEALNEEGQEQLVSLMLEPHGELIDDLADTMQADELSCHIIDATWTINALRDALEKNYGWALQQDYSDKNATARLWYVSQEKLEPRLAQRHDEPLEDYELPLAPGRDAARLMDDLADLDGNETLAQFLMNHPEHRHIVRRVQIVTKYPYAEIRDNTIAAEMLPIDLLRCKLSFFGATKFDPRSDRWVRINMYQGSPFPDELAECDPDDMAYPVLESP